MIRLIGSIDKQPYLLNPNQIEHIMTIEQAGPKTREAYYNRCKEHGVTPNPNATVFWTVEEPVDDFLSILTGTGKPKQGAYVSEWTMREVAAELGKWCTTWNVPLKAFKHANVVNRDGHITQQILNFTLVTTCSRVEDSNFYEKLDENEKLSDSTKRAIRDTASTLVEFTSGDMIVTESVDELYASSL